MEFRFEAFLGSSCSLNDADISFQILPPTLEKSLFWISSLDFLIKKMGKTESYKNEY